MSFTAADHPTCTLQDKFCSCITPVKYIILKNYTELSTAYFSYLWANLTKMLWTLKMLFKVQSVCVCAHVFVQP